MKIGVNENIVISKAEKNDKNTLVIGLREVGQEVKEKQNLSIAEQMAAGDDTTGDGGGESNFLMFMPSLTKYDKPEEPEDAKDVLSSFLHLKNQLSHFLKRFTTEKSIKFAPFAGVGVNVADEKDILAKIVMKAIAEKVYDNYITQFIAQVTPFLNKEDKPSRLFLHRRSEAKHFGTLRKMYLDNQPFWESMDIAIAESKLYTKQTDKTTKFHEPIEIEGIKYVPNFTPYELKNKLDDTKRVEGSDAPSANVEEELADVNKMFSAGTDEGEEVATASPGAFQIEE